jgi:dipeptidyl aminopeptidase/acylaminoacyl peptidase
VKPILLLFACASAAFSATLDQLLGSPFPSSLVASPAGGHIAWLQSAAGVRNVWVASPPDYTARQLTSFQQDDGEELSDLRFTSSSEALIFVRGSIALGEPANPMHRPEPEPPSIWLVPLAGSAPIRLAQGTAPQVHPKDNRIAFLHRGQVWWTALDATAKPELLLRPRGSVHSLRWSPDGAKLAFVNDRTTHSYVSVLDIASRSITYFAPSVDFDSDPVWSPDSKFLAFLRQPSSTNPAPLFTPRRAGHPFSIFLADTTNGSARQLFQADAGRGSVFSPIAAENQLLWSSTGLLVFPWERDGWLHLYSLATGGDATPKLLTFGDFEVEHVRLSPDGKEVLYSANTDDPERRHLYRVAAAGGAVTPLTSGKGIEWSPVMTSDGKALAFLRSDARLPARPAIMPAFGTPRDLVTIPFSTDSLVEPQPVTFTAADGIKIRAQLFLPPGNSTDKKPAIAYFHGGSRRQMLLGWHPMLGYHHAYAFNQYLASRGYVVLSVNFRSGTGYGMEFREALQFGAAGASEFQDVLGAGLYLAARPDVDPRRIGLWGASYGGYLTALGLARASGLFCAGVDIHGVHDWNVVMRNFNPSYNPLALPAVARTAFEASPLASVDTWKSPVLLIHGDADPQVPFSETVTLVEALRRHGVDFEQLVFPDEPHGFLRHARWLDVFRAASSFLDRRVRDRK